MSEDGICLDELPEPVRIVSFGRVRLPLEPRSQVGRTDLRESVVVATRHRHVDIVVPRDEPTMADRAKQGAVGEVIAEPVRLANADELPKDAELDLLQVMKLWVGVLIEQVA
jgi:hypothetical protein